MAKLKEIIKSRHMDYGITATSRGYTITKDGTTIHESVSTDDPKSVNNNADADTNSQRAKQWLENRG